ncbi:hypothetical protein HRI_005300800 [Hibiscus trionum]|uniref:Uncharacterized protein n=1 Tax=Hibiscus trionum TaxID=183268 RepID=A0A9W7MY53_HIBTR|nr:hypothetical protein HRI_004449000 [Hibiscus trionum]GMJ11050.1 hypothetical protein HRI_004774200 [Hibiscus trionum]GMJ16316.1 hypothetical protein HRI_005300800 [Hibiscus trionum]
MGTRMDCSFPEGPTRGSTGIFTCCPSTTPFGLILGPDPWTNLAEEPWVFGALDSHQCLPYSSRHSRFRLLRLLPLTRVLPPKAERSPTDAFLHPTASADRLAPFIFGARALDQ